ncbi:hypothetical protein FB451DRAFT_1379811 [Mycena latifolia]|nr:hypothetical protein FB451DRAFT_1379811 [Mycena latifolia]
MTGRNENNDKNKNNNHGEKKPKAAKVKFSLRKANPTAPRAARTLSRCVQQRAARVLDGGSANSRTISGKRRPRASNTAGALRGSRDALQPRNGDVTRRTRYNPMGGRRKGKMEGKADLTIDALNEALALFTLVPRRPPTPHFPSTPEALKEPATPSLPFASLASLFSSPELQPDLEIVPPQPPITVFSMLLEDPPVGPIYRPVRPLPRARFHEDCAAGTLAATNPLHVRIDPTPRPPPIPTSGLPPNPSIPFPPAYSEPPSTIRANPFEQHVNKNPWAAASAAESSAVSSSAEPPSAPYSEPASTPAQAFFPQSQPAPADSAHAPTSSIIPNPFERHASANPWAVLLSAAPPSAEPASTRGYSEHTPTPARAFFPVSQPSTADFKPVSKATVITNPFEEYANSIPASAPVPAPAPAGSHATPFPTNQSQSIPLKPAPVYSEPAPNLTANPFAQYAAVNPWGAAPAPAPQTAFGGYQMQQQMAFPQHGAPQYQKSVHAPQYMAAPNEPQYQFAALTLQELLAHAANAGFADGFAAYLAQQQHFTEVPAPPPSLLFGAGGCPVQRTFAPEDISAVTLEAVAPAQGAWWADVAAVSHSPPRWRERVEVEDRSVPRAVEVEVEGEDEEWESEAREFASVGRAIREDWSAYACPRRRLGRSNLRPQPQRSPSPSALESDASDSDYEQDEDEDGASSSSESDVASNSGYSSSSSSRYVYPASARACSAPYPQHRPSRSQTQPPPRQRQSRSCRGLLDSVAWLFARV